MKSYISLYRISFLCPTIGDGPLYVSSSRRLRRNGGISIRKVPIWDLPYRCWRRSVLKKSIITDFWLLFRCGCMSPYLGRNPNSEIIRATSSAYLQGSSTRIRDVWSPQNRQTCRTLIANYKIFMIIHVHTIYQNNNNGLN